MNSTESGTTMASVGEIRCVCGKLVKILTSTTSKNHKRRFMVCAQSNMDGGNDCEFFQWVDGPSVVMDAEQLEEMNKKLKELDTRISLLDEIVSEKLKTIERRVADFGEKVKAIEQRVEEMVDEMERKEVKHYGWKCWMVAAIVFVWCLVKFPSY